MPELSEVGLRKMEEERKAMRAAAEMTEQGDRDLEIPRLLSQLEFSLDRLSENLSRLLVRTEPVSNMDRAIPDDSPTKNPVEQPQTSVGDTLLSTVQRIDYLSEQINVRNYQLEI